VENDIYILGQIVSLEISMKLFNSTQRCYIGKETLQPFEALRGGKELENKE